MTGPRRRGGYRLLEHTADVTAEAEGPSWDAMASAMLEALAGTVFGTAPDPGPGGAETVPFSAETDDPALALVELLNEALYWMTVRGRWPVRYEGGPAGGTLVVAPVPAGTEPVREVKAATYGGLRCERLPDGGWRAVVTFDL